MKFVKKYLWIIGLSLLFVNSSYAFTINDDIPMQLSDNLNRLSAFEDIVVIQRRFLQKTGRFEISPSVSIFFSSEFFFKLGLGGSVGFYFLEKHGLELKGFYLFQVNREVAFDIYENLRISAASKGASTIGFAGLLYKWTPVYGKMAWWNKKIIPFDFSIIVGGGMSQVQQCRSVNVATGVSCAATESWFEPTLVLGFGQSYSLSRNLAFKVDIGFHYYGSLLFSQNIPSNQHYWDTYMKLAVSFYFPQKVVR